MKHFKNLQIVPIICILSGGIALPAKAATDPFSGQLKIPVGEVAAIWAQAEGHKISSQSSPSNLSVYSPPVVELRFIVSGTKDSSPQLCNQDKFLYIKESKNDSWTLANDHSFNYRKRSLSTPIKGSDAEADASVNNYALKQKNFKVALCTSVLDPSWYQVALSSKQSTFSPIPIWSEADSEPVLPASTMGPASIGNRTDGSIHMLTIGDTGCRGPDGSRSSRMWQDCSSWAFPSLMKKSVSGTDGVPPDITLHVGDYRYYLENQVKGADDSFDTWYREFIRPAQPLS